jgi:hypothetical protein
VCGFGLRQNDTSNADGFQRFDTFAVAIVKVSGFERGFGSSYRGTERLHLFRPNLLLDHLTVSITKLPFLFACIEKYEKNERIKIEKIMFHHI